MSLELILAAFGGGVFGATIGALQSFIFTGFLVLAGVAVAASGGTVDITGLVAFGPMFGPHIAFGGGVAAAAFAGLKKRNIGAGNDIVTPLNSTKDMSVLLVGGVFGVIGLLLNYVYGTILAIPTDTVALSVFSSGLIARLAFGATGVFGKLSPAGNAADEIAATGEASKKVYLDTKNLAFNIVMAFGLGLVFSKVVLDIQNPVLGFGFSAASLILVLIGLKDFPTTHHITLVAGVAAMQTGSIWLGALFAVVSAILCEVTGNLFNTYGDTHIDPPAMAIFISTFIVLLF
ncbi:hypothetical protein [Geosporobacter ferrireducens]|uniref:DUF7973 domain-containing protein n=1 Tax=Geosporobacter ferrireducens TaxID=1424294 RepID=A0A1D8GKF4_9FIRM|nr:hypothetical protein [Geosporobacter ferrireducens]AOT71342.1 hypothetical protein Gferi_18355 [Geosporobacter ferrireducens]MTI57655.1 hypothetical protein [Geosporobacter ferrireducens]